MQSSKYWPMAPNIHHRVFHTTLDSYLKAWLKNICYQGKEYQFLPFSSPIFVAEGSD